MLYIPSLLNQEMYWDISIGNCLAWATAINLLLEILASADMEAQS